VQGTLAAIDYGGPWEVPPINELFDFPAIPGTEGWEILGVSLAVNRTVLMIFAAVIIIAAFFWHSTRDATVVPSKAQNLAESFVELIRNEVALPSIGPEGNKFLPFLTTIFAYVFLLNLFKLTPGIMLPPTSRMAIPAFLAVVVLATYVVVGVRKRGGSYFKDTLFPPGLPLWTYVIVTPIELLSNFVLRPVTLAIRLFANMVAGHILVVLTLITIHAFLTVGLFGEPLSATTPIGVAALIASPAVFAFELLIITVQAFIFTILSAVYIGLAMQEEH